MVTRAELGERCKNAAAVQHPLGEIGMQSDSFPLLGTEWARVIPDPAGHADPSYIVHEPGAMDSASLHRRETRGLCGLSRERGNTSRVTEKPRRLQVGEVRHRRERAGHFVGCDRQYRSRLGIEDRRARVVTDLSEPPFTGGEEDIYDSGV